MRKPILIILCGGLILSLAMGIRQTFGLFLTPVTGDLGFGREAFALAMAVQNLLWGLFQPVTGMIADRFGAGRVVAAGGVIYAAGLVVMSGTTDIGGLNLGGGLLIGIAMAATGFSVILGAVARRVPEKHRSMALGVVSAGGSFGQFAMAPIGQALIAEPGMERRLPRHGRPFAADGPPGPGRRRDAPKPRDGLQAAAAVAEPG